MSKDYYPSIFSPQMEVIVFIILQIFFRNARSFDNWGIFNNYSTSAHLSASEIIVLLKIINKYC